MNEREKGEGQCVRGVGHKPQTYDQLRSTKCTPSLVLMIRDELSCTQDRPTPEQTGYSILVQNEGDPPSKTIGHCPLQHITHQLVSQSGRNYDH